MRNFIIIIFLVFVANVFAGPATFQGDKVKLFKDKLEFQSGTSITTSDSDDPTSVAKAGLKGSLYIRSSDGVVYIKQDDGVTTNWKPIAKYPLDLENGKVLIGNVSNLAAAVSLSGEATVDNTGAVTLDNDSVIGKTLTGFTSAAGTVAATDSIVEAIEKVDGNVAAINTLNSANIIVGNGSNVATDVAMSGEATIDNTGAVTVSNSAVIGKVLTGHTAGAGTVAATDSISDAIEKLDGNLQAHDDSVNNHADVSITTPAEGQHLEYDGTDWINSDMQESAGLIDHPVLTNNGDGTVGLNSVEVNIRSSADHDTPLLRRTIPAKNPITLTNNTTNYIYVDYATLQYVSTTDRTLINESSTLPVYRIYRSGNFIHSVDWDALGNGLSNKIHARIAATEPFKYESGLVVADKDATGAGLVVTVSSGVVWHGAVREPLVAMDSSVAGQEIRLCNVASSVWDCSTTSTGYNNSQYNSPTGLVTLTNNRYAVTWLFRGVEDQTHLYRVLGTGDYTLADAQNSSMPTLPELISSHALLVAKIITLKGATVPTSIQLPTSVSLTNGTAANHNDTLNKQGGTTDEYYHSTLNQYERNKDIEFRNYIKGYDSNAEGTLAGGWVTYDAGSTAARPTTGLGGSPTKVTFGRNTTTPLANTGDFQFTKASGVGADNGQGEGVAYAYTVGKADQTQILEVTFDYDTTSANYSCDATTTVCDIGVYSYDGTSTYLIGELPAGKGKFRGTFQTDSTNTHRIIFHVQSTDATAYTVYFDDIAVKPQMPAPVGTPDQFLGLIDTTTTWSNATRTFYYWRNGDRLKVKGSIVATGDVGTNNLDINLPNGWQIDSSKVSTSSAGVLGVASLHDVSGVSTTSRIQGQVRGNNTTTAVRVYITSDTNTLFTEPLNNTSVITMVATDTVYVDFEVPILGWSAQAQVSSNEYVRNVVFSIQGTPSSSTTSAIANVSYTGVTPQQNTAGGWDGSTEYTIQKDGLYELTVFAEISSTGSPNNLLTRLTDGTTTYVTSQGVVNASSGYVLCNPSSRTVFLSKGTKIRQQTRAYIADGTGAYSGGTGVSNGFIIKNSGEYSPQLTRDVKIFENWETSVSTISNSLATGGTAVFTDKVTSLTGAYNSSTGIFTAQRDGLFEVCAAVRHDSPTWTSGNAFLLLVGGDGVSTSTFNKTLSIQTATTLRLSGCAQFSATKGEQMWLRLFGLNAAGTEALNGIDEYNWVVWRSID